MDCEGGNSKDTPHPVLIKLKAGAGYRCPGKIMGVKVVGGGREDAQGIYLWSFRMRP